MYPRRELDLLATRKAIVLARIGVRRWECAAAAAELARPIGVVDRGIELWRRISPLVKLIGLPMTLLGARRVLRRVRGGKWSKLLALMPAILRGLRLVRQMRGARNGMREHATA